MLLGIKNKKTIFIRHTIMAVISVALFYVVWYLNPTWSPDMRLWKSFGGAAFMLLWFSLLIGPLSKIYSPILKIVSWRREAGIWLAIVSSVHGFLILNGWARWSLQGFLGYQYIPEINAYLRFEPGFGLANIMGITALLFILILAGTSFDKAVSSLGISSWKWLHSFAYVIFYLVSLHAIYFAFIHYTPSPHRILLNQPVNYPENPLRFYYLFSVISIFFVQIISFIKTVYKNRNF